MCVGGGGNQGRLPLGLKMKALCTLEAFFYMILVVLKDILNGQSCHLVQKMFYKHFKIDNNVNILITPSGVNFSKKSTFF